MTDCEHDNDAVCHIQLADDPVVPDSVSPQAELCMAQRFAEVVRIIGSANPSVHVVEDFRLDRAVELF